MRTPAEIYNLQDLELNDSRASALLLAIESCRKLGDWNELVGADGKLTHPAD